MVLIKQSYITSSTMSCFIQLEGERNIWPSRKGNRILNQTESSWWFLHIFATKVAVSYVGAKTVASLDQLYILFGALWYDFI
jgi:hypothetical protein